MRSITYLRLREKTNDGRIASTTNSDSRFHKTTNKSTFWTLNIRQKHTERHGSHCYWHFKKSIEPSEIPAVLLASNPGFQFRILFRSFGCETKSGTESLGLRLLYYHSLRFEKEAASERWGVPAPLNLTRFWGRSLSPSPVRLPILPWLSTGQGECKISHIAITEHVGFYVVTVTLDSKSGFLIWKFVR